MPQKCDPVHTFPSDERLGQARQTLVSLRLVVTFQRPIIMNHISATFDALRCSVFPLSSRPVRQVLSGRKLAGSTSLDAFSSTPLARKRIGKHVSFTDVTGSPLRAFYLTFGDRRWRWPMIDIVGTKMDWDAFLAHCDERDQRIVEMKIEGRSQTQIATELGISPPAVSQRLRALHQRWNAQAVA